MEELDEGDLDLLVSSVDALRPQLPSPGDRRRLLRHRLPPRRRALGRRLSWHGRLDSARPTSVEPVETRCAQTTRTRRRALW